jgi:hypothetical protein
MRGDSNCEGSVCHRTLTCRTPALEDPQSITSEITNTINIVQANLNGFSDEPDQSYMYHKCEPGYVRGVRAWCSSVVFERGVRARSARI